MSDPVLTNSLLLVLIVIIAGDAVGWWLVIKPKLDSVLQAAGRANTESRAANTIASSVLRDSKETLNDVRTTVKAGVQAALDTASAVAAVAAVVPPVPPSGDSLPKPVLPSPADYGFPPTPQPG